MLELSFSQRDIFSFNFYRFMSSAWKAYYGMFHPRSVPIENCVLLSMSKFCIPHVLWLMFVFSLLVNM